MNPRVLTLIGNGHQHNLSPTTNLTPGEKNDILHLLKKKQKGRQAEVFYFIVQGTFYLCTCINASFCKIYKSFYGKLDFTIK